MVRAGRHVHTREVSFPRADRLAAGAAAALVLASIVVGVALNRTGPQVQAATPPLYG